MQSLKDVVAGLRKEIEAGLALDQPLPHGVRLEADRVIATLQFCIDETSGAGVTFSVPGANVKSPKGAKTSSSNPIHSLAIEFKRCGDNSGNSHGQGMLQTSASRELTTTPLAGAGTDELTRKLSNVFGPPSFDSAARATVFREALENLSGPEVELLIRSLRGMPLSEKEATVKRSLSLLTRVLKSGPAGLFEGKSILVELLGRYSLKVILHLVASAWKSQQDWMG
ncbi:MAG: hypothetical protein JWM68_2230 [Verrucomicrobiales bacterium]|nr:hypothetical protein [Verrucomicrobiales bacterium]